MNSTVLPEEGASNSTNGTFSDDFYVNLYANSVNVIYTPILVILGLIGNLVSVYVFTSTKLRGQSTSFYLSALAISDAFFLMELIPPWLHAAFGILLFHSIGFCQLFVYLSYVSCCLSSWLVVAFTAERFVAVLYPLKRSSLCTTARARLVIGWLIVFSLTINTPVIWLARATPDDCSIDEDYMQLAAGFNLMDTVVSFTIPMALIVVLNAWITVGVYRVERRRALLTKGMSERAIRSLPHGQHRVTRMLLFVSTIYVVLNIPAYTLRIVLYTYEFSDRWRMDYVFHLVPSPQNESFDITRWAAMQQTALLFFNTNFGINFILYCLTGQNFRRALVLAFTRKNPRTYSFEMALRAAENRQQPRNSSVSASSNATEATSSRGERSRWGRERVTIPLRYGTVTLGGPNDNFRFRWTLGNRRRAELPPLTGRLPVNRYPVSQLMQQRRGICGRRMGCDGGNDPQNVARPQNYHGIDAYQQRLNGGAYAGGGGRRGVNVSPSKLKKEIEEFREVVSRFQALETSRAKEKLEREKENLRAQKRLLRKKKNKTKKENNSFGIEMHDFTRRNSLPDPVNFVYRYRATTIDEEPPMPPRDVEPTEPVDLEALLPASDIEELGELTPPNESLPSLPSSPQRDTPSPEQESSVCTVICTAQIH